ALDRGARNGSARAFRRDETDLPLVDGLSLEGNAALDVAQLETVATSAAAREKRQAPGNEAHVGPPASHSYRSGRISLPDRVARELRADCATASETKRTVPSQSSMFTPPE